MNDTTTAGAASGKTSRIFSRRTAMVLLGLLTAIAPFLAILGLGVPSWFPAGVTLDTMTVVRPGAPWNDPAWSIAGRLLWSLLFGMGVVTLMHLGGWCGRWLPPAFLLAGLAIPQACLWMTGQSKYCLIGGLIPFSDPSMYFDFASQMLENHGIVNGFTDRPMFAAMISSIFQCTGQNLQLVLAIPLAFCGGGMFLATREMRIRFGNVAAAVFLFVVFVFYNRSIGMLMTEHLGLALGLCAFALLLRGLTEGRRGAWFASLSAGTSLVVGGAGLVIVLPTAKLQRIASRAEFEKSRVGWFTVAVDRELALPTSEDAPVTSQGEPPGSG